MSLARQARHDTERGLARPISARSQWSDRLARLYTVPNVSDAVCALQRVGVIVADARGALEQPTSSRGDVGSRQWKNWDRDGGLSQKAKVTDTERECSGKAFTKRQ